MNSIRSALFRLLAPFLLCALWFSVSVPAAHLLVEAESFQQHGGWKLDTQFILQMGSPYLLAHGLGQPVPDATTTLTVPRAGNYRVWVRTKDWVAAWKAPGTPGPFQLLLDGKPLPETFGTRGEDWLWHHGGTVALKATNLTLALHDLTGFDGRCDAVLLSDDPNFQPPTDTRAAAPWRYQLRQQSAEPIPQGPYDLVVIGGGYAGTCAAISAARMGCKVALLQDRPVLGGNGSSEIRVWPQGGIRRGLFPRLGEIVEELADRPTQSPGVEAEFNDAHREAVVRKEPGLALFFNLFVFQVETRQQRIVSVTAMDTRTGRLHRFQARLFADCTGHGTVGSMAGADSTLQKTGHMGMSNMWRWKKTERPQPFPQTPWAIDMAIDDFPYPKRNAGEWFWESGFDLDPIADLERIRDWNLRAVFGAFSAMKNRDPQNRHGDAALEWVAYIGGNRESRQLLGDVVLNRDDIVSRRQFPDGCVPSTWDIDLHYAEPRYRAAAPANPFISKAEFDRVIDKVNGYPVPYRCFYSRNIQNLFMAGRCISVTHEALGTVRVMKTGGMMGEVVGKAASLCVKYDREPAAVYYSHLDELKGLMRQPGVARRETVESPIVIPPGAIVLPVQEIVRVSSARLEGTLVDDRQARLTGRWTTGTNLKPFTGEGYLYAAPKPAVSSAFEFQVDRDGSYEVRLAYQAHTNRASNARVSVTSVDGTEVRRINQKTALPGNSLSLGTFQFKAAQTNSVTIDNHGADGFVTIDAVQIIPTKAP